MSSAWYAYNVKKKNKTTSYHGASGGRKKSHSSQAIEDYET